LYICYC